MATAHTKVFTINRSQVIRLPRNVALPDSIKEVVIIIIAIGNQRLITPAGGSWDAWFDSPKATEDFMAEWKL